MTKDRFEWIALGLEGGKKLTKEENALLKKIRDRFERGEDISAYSEKRLETIYRAKTR